MKRKLLGVFICLLFINYAWSADYDFEAEGIYYSIIPGKIKEIEVTRHLHGNYTGDISIPASITTSASIEYKVTRIGESAFLRNPITSVRIADGITNIEAYAFFECKELLSISLPNTLKKIESFAFSDCGLTSITFPESLRSIGEQAFQFCVFKEIIIPEDLTVLGSLAFGSCDFVTSVNIPKGVKELASTAFSNCKSLKSINVSSENENYSSLDGILYNKKQTQLLCYPAGKPEKNYMVPATVVDPIAKLGNSVFSGVQYLESVTVDPQNPVYIAEDGVLFSKDKSKLIYFPQGRTGKYDIPQNTTTIGLNAFQQSSLNAVNVPNSVKEIQWGAFMSCKNLSSIIIPEKITEISVSAFSGCSSLEEVTLPAELKIIADLAFFNCSSLKSITIPDKVTNIYSSAFYNCKSLASVKILADLHDLSTSVFFGCQSLKKFEINNQHPLQLLDGFNSPFYNCPISECTLYVPKGTKYLYELAQTWEDFGSIVEGSITGINSVNNVGNISLSGNLLYANTNIAETILVYSVDGELLYSFSKERGEATFLLDKDREQILIVKRSSGQTKKIIRHL